MSYDIKIGNTFLAPLPDDGFHLCIVISDPDISRKQLLIVPAMTYDDWSDASCILTPGDHPFIQHRPYINYRSTIMTYAAKVENSIDSGIYSEHDPVNQEVLQRILYGARLSQFLSLDCQDLLEEQRLFDF